MPVVQKGDVIDTVTDRRGPWVHIGRVVDDRGLGWAGKRPANRRKGSQILFGKQADAGKEIREKAGNRAGTTVANGYVIETWEKAVVAVAQVAAWFSSTIIELLMVTPRDAARLTR
jgi:hypothetical protein